MEDVRFNLVSEARQIQVERITSTKICRWRRVRGVPVTWVPLSDGSLLGEVEVKAKSEDWS